MADSTDGLSQSPEDELTIPRAAVNKYIREICPNVRVGFDTRELLLQCCSEFIHVISSEANQACSEEQKKTITAEHIFKALHKLGFSDYVAEAEAVLRDCKALAAKKRRKSSRLENLGIPEEDLLRQQQELFAKAREEQLFVDQKKWLHLQQQASVAEQQQQQLQSAQLQNDDDDEYEDDDDDEP
ncbi:protein Dr1 [Hyalella azteca]|uniref:Protein Dr1 n=1 Tax=Hyalella azteca TaxID=294128 RepID=A0A8B7N8E9_HYAAZ|nr:protein Dr1 [Hyalella azteca]